MKRGKKLLALLAVLVLLICASTLTEKLLPEESESSTETAKDTSTSILTLDSESITSLTWTYEEETLTFNYADGVWSYADDSAFPVDDTYLGYMVTDISDLVATKTIENPSDLSEFGLDAPVCTISITENETTEILIGNENAVGGSRYISIGDGNVYLTDSVLLDDFSYTLFDLIEYETIPSILYPVELSVTTEDREYRVASETDAEDVTTWYHYEGENQIVIDTSLTETFIETVTNMSWNSCLDYNATEENLALYGLDTPAMSVTVTYETYSQEDTGEVDEDGNAIYETVTTTDTFSVDIGDAVDGYCYARIPGSNMIYWIEESIYTTLAETAVEDLQAEEMEN